MAAKMKTEMKTSIKKNSNNENGEKWRKSEA